MASPRTRAIAPAAGTGRRTRAAAADANVERVLDARPDTADFRDRMFEPTLVDVPTHVPLARHLSLKVPVLDQGSDGACTAFGLATVAHTLLRTRGSGAVETQVSTRMLYDMARRHDEWEGDDYSGSSCRGAMKGWHQHGVCAEAEWPYTPGLPLEPYTDARAHGALAHPLGAYARVNHKDLVALHAAFAEVGVLYASAAVHQGWLAPPDTGVIEWGAQPEIGYHAFAIVAYDGDGFWLQNSWGTRWGRKGFAYVSYDEWLARGTDVWAARLAVPVRLQRTQAQAINNSALAPQSTGYSQADLRPHIVSLGNDGRLRASGRFGTGVDDVRAIVDGDIKRITASWPRKRILLYAHGGLVPEDSAIQRVADYRQAMLQQQIYPLCFIWKTGFWDTLGNILRDAARPRSEGILDRARELLLDRLDDTLEPLARIAGGRALWSEMKENALLATTATVPDGNGGSTEAGGAAQVARLLQRWQAEDASVELHVAGHSAGSILMAPLVQLLTSKGQITDGPARGMLGMGATLASLTLWAPAITVQLFEETFARAIESGAIDRAALFTLGDRAERDDQCAGVYNKSLLYLVAHAFEAQPRNWIDRRLAHGTPLAGMALFIEDAAHGSPRLRKLIDDGLLDWVQAPTVPQPPGSPWASSATTHGGFDDDAATLQATVARILGKREAPVGFDMHRSEPGLEARRERLHREIVEGG